MVDTGVGRFELRDLIWESGDSRVQTGLDTDSGLPVLVKSRRLRDATGWTEARYLQRLRYNSRVDPGVAAMPVLWYTVIRRKDTVVSVLPDEGYRPICLEKLSPETILQVFLHISLAFVRSRRWPSGHNNLKPGNLLVSDKGSPPRVCDADPLPFPLHPFAYAKENMAVFFAPPEALRGQPFDGPTDPFARRRGLASTPREVFSLGALLSWALGGQLPDRQLLLAMTRQPEQSVRLQQSLRLPASIPDPLVPLLERCFLSADERPEIDEFAAAILDALVATSGPASTQPAGWLTPEQFSEDESPETSDELAPGLVAAPSPPTNASEILASLLPQDRRASTMKAELDRLVVGQQLGKTHLTELMSMHLTWWNRQDILHVPPNGILIGKTGVGKTHTIKTLARYLSLPYVIADATSLVPSGIVGMQVEDILQLLVKAADSLLAERGVTRSDGDNLDIEFARRGIVFLDEFDKIHKRRSSFSDYESVQRRLLKMVEGSLMSVGQRHHIDEDPRYIDTTGILFVASGAFVGITDTDLRNLRPQDIRRRLMNENVIIAHDVINFGFVPELVARFQVTVQFMDLTTDELCQIMTAPDTSPITVWVNHFEELGKKLVVEPAAIRAISSRALMLELGARGLQQILFELLAEISYGFETSEEGSYTLTEQEVMKGWRN